MDNSKKYGWACDFETYYDPQINETYVWCWAAYNIYTEKIVIGKTIDEFFEWSKTKTKLWFHNLKYDGYYILDYAMKNGYTHCYKHPKEKQFTSVISNVGQWYSISFNHGAYKSNTVIQDSLKKLPFSIKQIGKSFNLGVTKGEMDYSKYRSKNHELTPDEREYLESDVKIIGKALKIVLDRDMTKLTIGADTLKFYKQQVGKSFDKWFPELKPTVDDFVRQSYKGGYTYLLRPGEHKDVYCYDVNSLYPYCMTFELPYGQPIYYDGAYIYNEKYPLYVQHFYASFKLKPDHLPTVNKKSWRFSNETEFFEESDEPLEFFMTSVDYELFKEQYDIYNLSELDGFMFKSRSGLFDDYINYWMNIKENSEGAERQIAKLFLNSLYGKFAKNPDITMKVPTLFENRIRLVKGEQEYGKTLYIPVGAFITAYARRYTITAAQANYDRFIYCDTDSIYITGSETPIGVEVHDTKLGCWAFEIKGDRGKFLRAKRYIIQPTGDSLYIKCAGMPDNIKERVTWGNFNTGELYNGKLVPVPTPGGVRLNETTFRMV